ncbi:MAG: sigma-70 family RNA polymerase sigma factor, partial [Clostridia bacterium]|nr:sigma-70 family RNA polymerase sigma factor [Clostridia bacterium]
MSDPFDDFEGFVSSSRMPDEELESREIGRVISDYLKQTSDKKLYIFISRYYFAIPIKEIANKLNCSESSVNKEIKAIKTELLQKLNKEGIDL